MDTASVPSRSPSREREEEEEEEEGGGRRRRRGTAAAEEEGGGGKEKEEDEGRGWVQEGEQEETLAPGHTKVPNDQTYVHISNLSLKVSRGGGWVGG